MCVCVCLSTSLTVTSRVHAHVHAVTERKRVREWLSERVNEWFFVCMLETASKGPLTSLSCHVSRSKNITSLTHSCWPAAELRLEASSEFNALATLLYFDSNISQINKQNYTQYTTLHYAVLNYLSSLFSQSAASLTGGWLDQSLSQNGASHWQMISVYVTVCVHF